MVNMKKKTKKQIDSFIRKMASEFEDGKSDLFDSLVERICNECEMCEEEAIERLGELV